MSLNWRRGPVLRGLLLLLLFFSGLIVRSQTLPPKVTIHKPGDYGAHNQVFCGEQLSDGRTAFSAGSTVFLHHGEGFDPFPGDLGKDVVSMDTDTNGRLFLGGRSLIGVVTPDSTGSFSFHSLIPLLPDSLKDFGIVWSTFCTPEGNVYFNAKEHLLCYDGDTVTVLRPEGSFIEMHAHSGDPIVQDPDSGLYRVKGDKVSYLPGTGFAREQEIKTVLPPAGTDKGALAVFTREHGIYHYDPSTGKKSLIGAEEEGSLKELRQAEVYSACRLRSENNPYGAAYAVGTIHEGLFLLDAKGHIVLHLKGEEELPANLIWQVFPDDQGNVWAATNNGIAFLHTGRPFTLMEKGKLFEGGVNAISLASSPDDPSPTAHSTLFLASDQGGWFWREKEGDFSFIEGSSGQSMALLPFTPSDREPRMLVSAGISGVLSVPFDIPSQVEDEQAFSLTDHMPHALTKLPFPKRKAGILLGGREGMQVITPHSKRGEWKDLITLNDLPEELTSIGWDTSTTGPDSLRLWGGMPSKGVLSIKADTAFRGFRITRFDSSQGLPKGPVKVFQYPFKNGEVLFGTENGLYRFKDGRFVPEDAFGPVFYDSGRQIFRLKEGVDKDVWIVNPLGGQIKRLIPQANGSYRIDSTIFRSLDLGTIRCLLPLRGRTWIGGSKGLACYFPEMEVDLDREWNCLIREVRGSDDTLLFGGWFAKKTDHRGLVVGKKEVPYLPVEEQPKGMTPVLPYEQNRLVFKFAAPYPDRQQAVEYRYKLAGSDTSWSKWTDRVRKEYTNIPEGSYTFKVKARNVYLKESRTATYHFRILPPWYRTWSAYGGYAVAGIGVIWLLLWLNSRRLLAQKQRLERIVDERTKEIREQKEEVEKKNRALEEANETISKQKEEVEEAHREITHSIDYAQKIQYALLQSEEHVSPHLPGHFILFKPQSQVSGDFYWAKEHQGFFYIAAVDCTGHGVPGAFMSMLGISQLNEIMNTDEVLSPGYILTDLRDRVVRELSGSDPDSAAKDGMDAAIVRIPLGKEEVERGKEGKGESEKGEAGYEKSHSQGEGFNPHGQESDESEGTVDVQFAGAQNPLYVIRKGIAEELPSASMEYQGEALEGDPVRPFKKTSDGIEIKGDGQPVGYDEYAKDAFTTVRLQLQKGDMLYTFSDGYADQFGGPKGKKFRYGPFKQLLVNIHERPLEEQKQELDRTFEDWKAESEQEQIDDVVVIGVKL